MAKKKKIKKKVATNTTLTKKVRRKQPNRKVQSAKISAGLSKKKAGELQAQVDRLTIDNANLESKLYKANSEQLDDCTKLRDEVGRLTLIIERRDSELKTAYIRIGRAFINNADALLERVAEA